MAWVIGIGIALLLLFSFPKQIGILVGVIALAILGIAAFVWMNSVQKERQLSQVKLSVSFEPDDCSEKYPFRLRFENGTKRTIEKTTFSVYAYRPGFSDAVSRNTYLETDKIMRAGNIYISCWKFVTNYGETNVDPRNLTWKASVTDVEFQ